MDEREQIIEETARITAELTAIQIARDDVAARAAELAAARRDPKRREMLRRAALQEENV